MTTATFRKGRSAGVAKSETGVIPEILSFWVNVLKSAKIFEDKDTEEVLVRLNQMFDS